MPLGTTTTSNNNNNNTTLTQLSARSPVYQDMKENMAAQLKRTGGVGGGGGQIQSSQNLNITAEGEFSLG
jgi:hypothetical protein